MSIRVIHRSDSGYRVVRIPGLSDSDPTLPPSIYVIFDAIGAPVATYINRGVAMAALRHLETRAQPGPDRVT
ncbi:MAG TPA: hypothetical protein VKA32_09555 [Gammaproteobacteria bacterium]|nr:hypothetical protein [Gammaproteobacteria bacterium]